jgi:elongation factor Ts
METEEHMADISAEMVRKLREETGAGMMDCKAALVEASGDIEKARDVLRKRGMATAAKKAGRATSEGMVGNYIHPGAKIGVLVEVDCETDFVAKTPDFQTLVKEIAMHIAAANPLYVSKEEVPGQVLEKEREIYKAQAAAAGKPGPVQEKIAEGKLKQYLSEVCLLEQPFVRENDKTVGQLIQEKIALIKENIVVRRFARFKVGEEARAAAPADATSVQAGQ